MNRVALIPAYQPDDKLINVIKGLSSEGYNIIVVNDGSDESSEPMFSLASQMSTVITHTENKGKGEALKTGLRYIKANFKAPYIVVTADADGQHKTADIIRVSDEAERHKDSLVLGSRKLHKDVPIRSRFGNSVTRWLFLAFLGRFVYDTQTGLRAFGDQIIDEMIEISGSRYEYEMIALMELAKQKTEIREVFIETVYLDNNSSSHFNPVKDFFKICGEMWKFSVPSIVAFLANVGLFCLLFALTGQVIISNVLAMIVGVLVRDLFNIKYAFKPNGIVKSTLITAFIIVLDTALLKGLTLIYVNPYVAKVLTEIVVFVLSYIIKKALVFRKEKRNS